MTGQPAEYHFDVFGTQAGLPQTNVTTAVQTRDGYLWVGTEGGLGRFDGVRFVTWRKSSTPELENHSIRCLFEDRDGALWIGTEQGLVRYRAHRFEAMGLREFAISSIAQDRSGAIWVGTAGAGLHRWESGSFHRIEADAIPRDAVVQHLFVDAADRLWMGVRHFPGVLRHDGAGWTHFTDRGRMAGETNAICELPKGTIWLGNAHGLYRLRGDTTTYFGKNNGLVSMQVRDLKPARNGGLWIAAGGLHFAPDPEKLRCTPIYHPSVRSIHRVFEDMEGSVWVCAGAEALLRVRRSHVRTVPALEGLPTSVVKAVSEDAAGNLWVAVQREGVVRLGVEGDVLRLTQAHRLLSANPLAILAARDGAVWIAYSTGVCVWREGAVEVIKVPNVTALFEDAGGTMWLGGTRTLMMCGPAGEFGAVPLEGGDALTVQAFAADRSGAIYVGHAAGVRRYRNGKLDPIGEHSDVRTAPVRALHVDTEGRVWVGMKGRGLGVLVDDAEWLNPDPLAEVVSDHVSAITEDAAGRLWLGTPSGVMWADKADLLAVARGLRATPRIRVAGQSDGFGVMPVSSGSQPSVARLSNGELLFATRRGLVRIDPGETPTNAIAPKVHIEAVSIDGRAVPPASRLDVPAGSQAVSIEYTAPSFVHPSRVLFQYKLEPYQKEWVAAGTRRAAFYTNLPPGSYTFRVRACNSDGVWNADGAALAVVQQPHFYQTWWFYGIAAVGVMFAGVGVNRWSHRRLALRLARLEERQAAEKERRRIAKDLHDDIGASLTEIGLFAEKMKSQAPMPEIATMMNFFSVRVHRIAGALDAVVWTVNPANDSLDRLASFIVEMFQDFLRQTSIRCRLDVADEFPRIPLAPEERSHLFLTAKEAINNVVRHSHATEAWLKMSFAEGAFSLSIEDDGRGFLLVEAEGRGNGLANMRSRIEELGGTIEFGRASQGGSRVAICVPLSGRVGAARNLSS